MVKTKPIYDRPAVKKIVFTLISFCCLFIAGLFDHKLTYRVSSMLLYLPAIAIAVLFVSRYFGIMQAVLSTIVWLSMDLKTGGSRYVYFFMPYWNALARISFFMTVVLSIEFYNNYKREKSIAVRDPLTGVLNRRGFYEYAGKELERSKRYKHPFSLIFLDCDDFKQINDNLGHAAGDKLLWNLAHRIDKSMRTSDIVARLGGDEFAVLLAETDHEGALQFVKRLRLDLLNVMQRNNWPVTYTFGLAPFEEPPDSIDHMLRVADEAMYSAKKKGKDRIELLIK
jgi:diguanylate cyclase (GGDEF)-like protein